MIQATVHFPDFANNVLVGVPASHPEIEYICMADAEEAPFDLIGSSIYHGYLPMSVKIGKDAWVTSKLHHERCIIDLTKPGAFTFHKRRRKRAKGYKLHVTKSVDETVCENIRKFTWTTKKNDNWLVPKLEKLYKKHGVMAMVAEARGQTDGAYPTVTFYSTTVTDEGCGKVVAGEVGYTCGSIYTSLTGYYDREHSGSG